VRIIVPRPNRFHKGEKVVGIEALQQPLVYHHKHLSIRGSVVSFKSKTEPTTPLTNTASVSGTKSSLY